MEMFAHSLSRTTCITCFYAIHVSASRLASPSTSSEQPDHPTPATSYHRFHVVVAHRDCRCGHLAEYNCGRSETCQRTRNRAIAVRSHISWVLSSTPMDPDRLARSVASGVHVVEVRTCDTNRENLNGPLYEDESQSAWACADSGSLKALVEWKTYQIYFV